MPIKSMRCLILLAALLPACSLQKPPPASPSPQTHVLVASRTDLYAVQLSGGADTRVATTMPAVQFTDLARNPLTGTLYAVSSNMLFRVDPQTGATTAVGGRNMNALNALAFNGRGELFAGDEYGHFYRIDPLQGVATRLNETGHPEVLSGDLAFTPDGTLYATVVAQPSDRLVTVNVETGAVSPVGLTGFEAIYGLTFADGTLYGMTGFGELLALDRQTGRAQLLRQTALRQVFGME